jgi:hypothetical protein
MFAIALSAVACSCSHLAQPVRATMQPLPPLSGRIKIATTIVPRSQKFKVAVLTFIDQTGRAQLVVDPIADMLTTELFGVKRFELYDRQDLVEQTHATFGQNQQGTMHLATEQKTAHQYEKVKSDVDGILLGYITSFKMNEPEAPPAPPAPPVAAAQHRKAAKEPPPPPVPAPVAHPDEGTGEFDCDFRIVNALASGLKELVVFSDSAKVKFRMKGGNIELDRSGVAAIASEIKKKFPEFSKQTIKITSLQEGMVSLNVGESSGVKQGFTGYVVEKDEKTGVYRYLAEFVVINVFPEAATAVVMPGPEPDSLSNILANIRVGSEAVLK